MGWMDNGDKGLWGDEPQDAVDAGLDALRKAVDDCYQRAWGRPATHDEYRELIAKYCDILELREEYSERK